MESDHQLKLSRRKFLIGLGGLSAALVAKSAFATPIRYLEVLHIDNPLAQYPNRDWEKVYRNLFKPDSSFVFLCAPNDTHNCLLKAFVKNDVVVRIGPSFGYGKATDLYGNQASHRWDPRICQKGLALGRRIYGDRRLKSPMVRKGFKEWVDAGFPRNTSTGSPDPKYFQRGKDKWERLDWDEAFLIAAKATKNIAEAYSGEKGSQYLRKQEYDESMIEAVGGAGVRTMKFRGGMAFLGATRIYGLYRFANMMSLLDANIRGVGQDQAKGARGLDSYSWHTDLPPGHPMVTGVQTNDFDLFAIERSKLALIWGMNWITTKMPDSHWLTEARLKGTKIVSVTVEYSSTASKSDDVVVIRPGTDPAYALALAQVIIAEDRFDKNYVAKNTDLPFLIRMDTLEPLRPKDVYENYTKQSGKNISFLSSAQRPSPTLTQNSQFASDSLRQEFESYLIWDKKSNELKEVSRDLWGEEFEKTGIEPDLRAEKEITLKDGTTVKARTIFSLTEQYLNDNLTPNQAETVTWAPAESIVRLAREIAANPEQTLFCVGMGPNQFFNADLKDRAIFLVAALTRNVGYPGGNVGSYAGNYKISLFSGIGQFGMEDPFDIQLDNKKPVKTKGYLQYESLHYLNYGSRPLRVGNKLFTGSGHVPTPTKVSWQSNSNSSLGNIKWHYDFTVNTLPKIEFVCYTDWWWTASCEYSDLVFACDSWAEFSHPDMTASCTNPFLQVYPRTPLARIFNTKHDIEILAGVAKAMGELTSDKRFSDMWKFVYENKVDVYLQRIIDASPALKGYKFPDLEAKAKQGIPALMNNRTYPRVSSYEQSKNERPWHTKSGRLEFYRFEPEFIEHGENLVVHREPVDATPYEPNVILAKAHPAIRPHGPEKYGIKQNDLSVEVRQVRNVLMQSDELPRSRHPLRSKRFTHVYHTPKYRHGAHTTPVDTDFTGVWFGPFGDIYRRDKRMPSVVEGYVDINPLDAKELKVEDGDYVWVDADPEDRPYRGWKKGTEDYKVARLLLRARYYPGTPRGIARTWHNMFGASHGSVIGHESREDGLAKNPSTNYQAMFRYGSHQSATRAWLRPTLMTDSLVRKNMFGEGIGRGFAPDIHCPNGAPRESFVKISKAEDGGMGGKGLWRPITLGIRPSYESEAMKKYIQGGFLKTKA
jgi:nitrate reductase / nitrite oxidoreductase, alpha subunit